MYKTYANIILKSIIFLFLSLYAWSSYCNEVFKNLSINEGLAHTDANCIVQDSTGLIWIGTYAGLQSYDGYSLKLYDYYIEDQKIYQSHNRIHTLACSANKLWVGTESGLTCMDLESHHYVPFRIADGSQNITNGRILKVLLDNQTDHLWIKTEYELYAAKVDNRSNTLHIIEWKNKIDRKKIERVNRFELHQNKLWFIEDSHLTFLEIKDQKVVQGNRYNLTSLLKSTEEVSCVEMTDQYAYIRTSTSCYRLKYLADSIDLREPGCVTFNQINPSIPRETLGIFAVDNDENLWCTYSGGVFEVRNPFSEQPTIKTHLENNKNINLSKTRIASLLIDRYNNLWIAMMNWGVNYKSLNKSLFQQIPTKQLEQLGLKKNVFLSMEEADNQMLWFLVDGGEGLFCYDFTKDKVSQFKVQKNGNIASYQTLKLSLDQKKIYIGLSKGLLVYHIETGASDWVLGGPYKKHTQGPVSVSRIQIDRFGNIWVATWGSGLYRIKNIDTAPSVTYYTNVTSPVSIVSNYVSDIYIEPGTILVCTDNGLNKITLTDQGEVKQISSYQTDANKPNSLSSNFLASIDKQEDSVYWIGTIGGGVNKITIHSNAKNDYSATCFTSQNGLTSNDAEIVFVDEEHNVWIGGNGITKINTKTEKISVYESIDGLQSNSFKIGAGYKSKDGRIYMGGLNGCNYFYPKSFLHPSTNTELIFTDLLVHNKPINPNEPNSNGKITLTKSIDKYPHVNLSYNQNNFILSFAALGYHLSNRIMYRYRMVGYDKTWQIVPYAQNKAFYSNLNYGDYRFELEVSTDRGFSWKTPGKTIKFSILPPWWQTTYAWIAYILVILAVTFIIIYQYSKGLKLKRENHIQELQRLNDEERYQSKLSFFMNVSHELKTPLTLISLAAERLMENNFSKESSSILYHSKKILSMISEIVDIRKADLGINLLSLSDQNIHEITDQLFREIQPWAEEKKITMTYQAEDSNIHLDLDKEKIAKLIINLLSNAVKYTLEGGSIDISLRRGTLQDIHPLYATTHSEGEVSKSDELCILTVRDSGVGISPESIKYIYERFFQVKSINQIHLGSGIGLAIAKSMVLLHRGTIIVSSERMTGSEFIVAIPIRHESKHSATLSDDFNAKEFIQNQYLEYNEFEQKQTEDDTIAESLHTNLPSLLVVEDNKYMQQALKEHFSASYQVTLADDGKQGLELCESIYPDIIISDLMMPEMNGIDMCKRIRNNLSIAYIPIILLTAKDEMDSQIEGYESGADLYMAKPFSMRLLEVNLNRLLKQRERVWEQSDSTTETAHMATRDILLTNENKKFEEKLKLAVENNMANPELSVDFLTQELGLGRTKLYQKVKESCNQSLADYIRNMRLEKSTYLLLNSTMNISEIMTEVGFVNNSHFTKVFRLKYGVTPSEYIKNHQ